MKKALSIGFIVLTVAVLSLTVGFFYGRNSQHEPMQILKLTVSADAYQASAPEADSQLININTASVWDLTALPGIGTVLAQRIVDYRQEIGGFTSLDQLTQVEGIGAERLEAILDNITLGGSQ